MQSAHLTVAGTCHSVLKSLIPALKYRSFNNIGNFFQHFTNPLLSSPFFVTPDFLRHPASAQNSKLLLRKLRPFGQPTSPHHFRCRGGACSARPPRLVSKRSPVSQPTLPSGPHPRRPALCSATPLRRFRGPSKPPASRVASRPTLIHSSERPPPHSNEYHSIIGIDKAPQPCYTPL
jgi:hypothetical protein